MKSLGIFLLITLVLLSALPCNDADDCSLTTLSSIQVVHADEEQESCTEICACICCRQNVVKTVLTLFEVSIPETTVSRKAEVRNFKSTEIPQNIWQPPKFS